MEPREHLALVQADGDEEDRAVGLLVEHLESELDLLLNEPGSSTEWFDMKTTSWQGNPIPEGGNTLPTTILSPSKIVWFQTFCHLPQLARSMHDPYSERRTAWEGERNNENT